jgi:hypothetical protein
MSTSVQSKHQSSISNQIPQVFTNVRPSTAFISLSRAKQVQKAYVDEQGKEPSSLLRRDDVPTLRSQGAVNHIPFNQERDKFSALNNETQKA